MTPGKYPGSRRVVAAGRRGPACDGRVLDRNRAEVSVVSLDGDSGLATVLVDAVGRLEELKTARRVGNYLLALRKLRSVTGRICRCRANTLISAKTGERTGESSVAVCVC